MKLNIKKELPLICIVLLPFIYLAYVWNDLPSKVPVYWNTAGEVNRYGSRYELLLIPFLLPFLIYVLLTVIPKIDPKQKLQKMGGKLANIKFLLTTFMSVLALFIIYTAKNQTLGNPNYILLLIGVLYIILGNYFKTVKPNYFIGIRTPWTLESETVWNKTHKLAGVLWFVGGVLVVLLSLLLSSTTMFTIFYIITAALVVVPVGYSYLIFKREKNEN